MPGLYLNDGGQLGSALGSALGQLAQNVSPQGQAEAQLRYQQTQGADIANENAFTQQQLNAAAARQSGGLLGTFGADATPAGGSGTVAGAAASLAQPPADATAPVQGPGGRYSLVDTRGMTPLQTYTAGRVFTGMSPSDLTTLTGLGRDATLGPGMDYGTQGDIYKAQHMPRDAAPGTKTYLDPTKGDVPGNVLTGGSEYGSTVDKTTGASNPAALEADIRGGQAAEVNYGKAQQGLAIFDQFVAPNTDPAGILTEEVKRKLSETLGINLSRFGTVGDAKAQIKQYFLGMLGGMRDPSGNPMSPRALEFMAQQFPDPDADPVRFHSMVNALITSMDQQRKDGQAALNAYRTKTPEAYLEYLQQKGVNAEAARKAFEQAGIDIRKGAEEAGGGAAPVGGGGAAAAPALPTTPLRPASQQEIVFARDAVSKGQSRDAVVAHAKSKGIDLGPNF